jgi:hypothetical protein
MKCTNIQKTNGVESSGEKKRKERGIVTPLDGFSHFFFCL